MKMAWKCSGAFLVLAIALAVPLSLSAQDKAGAEVTLTGCFNKADVAGYYVIADEASKKTVTVTGDAAMLDRHANNHRVTLKGSMTKDKDKEVFKATNLQMLSVCQ